MYTKHNVLKPVQVLHVNELHKLPRDIRNVGLC